MPLGYKYARYFKTWEDLPATADVQDSFRTELNRGNQSTKVLNTNSLQAGNIQMRTADDRAEKEGMP